MWESPTGCASVFPAVTTKPRWLSAGTVESRQWHKNPLCWRRKKSVKSVPTLNSRTTDPLHMTKTACSYVMSAVKNSPTPSLFGNVFAPATRTSPLVSSVLTVDATMTTTRDKWLNTIRRECPCQLKRRTKANSVVVLLNALTLMVLL